jgi:predicted DNA binding CopG/RHH family protein
MSREQKAGLVTVTVRLPPNVCDALIRHKVKHGVTVQKFITEAITEKLNTGLAAVKPAAHPGAKAVK